MTAAFASKAEAVVHASAMGRWSQPTQPTSRCSPPISPIYPTQQHGAASRRMSTQGQVAGSSNATSAAGNQWAPFRNDGPAAVAVWRSDERPRIVGQLPAPGRHLQILDHTVHRIDAHTKANGEEEKEMVVSNLRHFTLKIGVLDPRMGMGRDAELPLKAELLYENGQLVGRRATRAASGRHEVVAMQGTALFASYHVARRTATSSASASVFSVDTNLLREPVTSRRQ